MKRIARNRGRSVRSFNKGARKTNRVNHMVARGGYRL